MLNLQKEKSTLKAENLTLTRQLNEEKDVASKLKSQHRQELQNVKWLNDDMEMTVENLRMEINRLKSKINRLELENEGLRKQITGGVGLILMRKI